MRRRKVTRKNPVACSKGYEEENALSENDPQQKAEAQKANTFKLAQGKGSLAAVECPYGNEVQNVEPRAGPR